jgi:hypothetical protein
VRPVLTSLPPITIGMSICSLAIASSRDFRDARSGEPGAYSRTGSLNGVGSVKTPELMPPAYRARTPGDGLPWRACLPSSAPNP